MATDLSVNSVLAPAPWCVVRGQEEGHLIYNPRTDELHLLRPSSFCVYQLCDGLRSVGSVCAAFAGERPSNEVNRAVTGLLDKLVARGLLEIKVMSSVIQPGGFRPRTPFHMVWLATNACNARCLHCSSNSSTKTMDELSTAEAIDLIDQMVDLGVLDLAISGGEPLLRPDLFTIIGHARYRGLTVGVGSNGGKLTVKQAELLATSGINRFQLGLDGLEQSHDRLRCWPGLFRRVLQTIERAAQANLRVHVCCTINRLNHRELDEFVAVVASTASARINFSRYIPTGRGSEALDLMRSEWQAVIARCVALRDAYLHRLEIVSHLAQQILVDDAVACLPGFVGCQAGSGQGCVTANGTVLPCVLLPVPVGNIRDRCLRDLWLDSPVIRSLQTRTELKDDCGRCGVQNRCGGCRAVAYAKTGDYLATDTRCWLVSAAEPVLHTIL